MEVANDAAFENKITNFDGSITPGQTIYVRVKATSNSAAGAVQTITAAARPSAPVVTFEKTTGVFTTSLETTTLEYKVGNGEWTDMAEDKTIAGYSDESGKDVVVRVKAIADSSFASEATAKLNN